MLKPPIAPMEARSVDVIPTGSEWQYEPKWDGFRCLVFRDGDKVALQSKSGKPLTRYFPDVVAAAQAIKAKRFVLDGEIVVPRDGAFSFDDLLQRIHPAASRIEKLSRETPALLIVFDLLGDERGNALLDIPLSARRPKLEAFAKKNFGKEDVRLSPATTRLADAKGWLKKVGSTLDGIIAKRRDAPYGAGTRDAMVKIKNYRSADCVVGGFRYGTNSRLAGSLLLGLYDDDGLLHHVGFTSSIARGDKPALTAKLEKLKGAGFSGNAPGGPSRWSTERSAQWVPLKPSLVVEVCYDHFSGERFRHGTRLMRWRPDKAPKQCTMDQVKQKKADLMKLLA
ncbi:MAG TPA: ATP-dependent DNA ligase [Xanthobacteraceae bacterium]|nr:ATP-dependent DNA ligase [Xanthobacteraceae bacterium]